MAKLKVLFFVLFGLCLFTFINALGNCRGKTTCKGLRDCAPVISLIKSLRKPLKPSVVQFLKAQQCGFADGYPKVCCGVLPKNLKIFNKQRGKQHAMKLNRTPTTAKSVHSRVNKLSIYQPDPSDLNPPHFDITVSTAPPGATTVPYLRKLLRDRKETGGDNRVFNFDDVIRKYGELYDLQRTRRSGVLMDEVFDIEVR